VDESSRAFYLKVVGGGICIALGVAGMWNPPLVSIPPILAGALLTGGLLSFGVNIGATVAAGREAAHLRAARAARAAGKPYP